MINLPFPANPNRLKSFWLIMSLASGTLVGFLSAWFISPKGFVAGAVWALVVAATGLLRPRIAATPYRIWNLLAHGFSRLARGWLLRICYYLVMVTVGHAGSKLQLTRADARTSQWEARKPHASAAFNGLHGILVQEHGQTRWASAFFTWAISTKNYWACCLLPFFKLLAALGNEEEESTVSASVYTLF